MIRVRAGFLGLVFLITGTFSCSGRHNASNPGNAASIPEKGKINPDVRCILNKEVSYALYLPSGYTPDKKFPLILAFDAHGGGNLPLEMYKTLAESHGCILIGSNNSKNGLPMNETGIIVQALFTEIRSRYSIDTARITTMGFSGGSRIASLVAFSSLPVSGVIGCGAGFPGLDQAPQHRFDFLGIAGNADFNMNELMSLDGQLEEAKFRHALIIFDGIHAWPPLEIMQEAFTWNDFCAMKENRMPKDQKAIDAYIKFMDTKISREKKSGDMIKIHRDLLNKMRFLDGLAGTTDVQSEITALEADPVYMKELKAEQENSAYEAKQQKMLTDNFFTKELPWWKTTIGNYDSRIKQAKDSNDVRVCRRLKSYLSLVCYMSYTRVLTSNDTVAAAKAMKIYEMADPENAAKTKAGKVK